MGDSSKDVLVDSTVVSTLGAFMFRVRVKSPKPVPDISLLFDFNADMLGS